MTMTAPVGFAGGSPPLPPPTPRPVFVALGAQELNSPAGMQWINTTYVVKETYRAAAEGREERAALAAPSTTTGA